MALHLPAKDDPRWCLIATIVAGIAATVAFYKAMYPHAIVLVATALVLGIIYAKDRG